MNDLAFEQSPTGNGPALRHNRHVFDQFNEFRRESVGLPTEEHPVLLPGDRGLVGVAQPGGRFDERLQHGLEVEGRAADDLEHVGGRGLLLQRFAKLVEQPCVLDGDDRLLGEVAQQLDLLVSERADLLSIDHDCADQLGIPKHRYSDERPSASEIR